MLVNHQKFEEILSVYTENLLQAGIRISNANEEKTRKLVTTLLAMPNANQVFETGGATGINYDGTPLQYCISTRKESLSGRFLADPAYVMGNAFERFTQSCLALKEIFELTGTNELKIFCEEMFNFHLPKNGTSLSMYTDGVLWLGAPVSGEGLAVYMDGRREGNQEGWNRFSKWLVQLMPRYRDIHSIIQNLSSKANILSIGFEGSSLKNLRAKVYWRLNAPCLLDDLGIDFLKDDEFKIFLNELVQDRKIKLDGLVFSAGFHLASQQLFDCKIDVCACPNCINQTADKWVEVLDYFTQKYELSAFPIENQLHEKTCEVSYFGFGMDILGNKRMNLYLKAVKDA